MTKEQHIKNIKSIINSPRNDEQKISMIEQSFLQYVNDTMERIIGRLENCSGAHRRLSTDLKEYHPVKSKQQLQFSGCYQNAIKVVKKEGAE